MACKKIMSGKLIDALRDTQEKRRELEASPSYIKEILDEGIKKARKVASITIAEVRKVMKL